VPSLYLLSNEASIEMRSDRTEEERSPQPPAGEPDGPTATTPPQAEDGETPTASVDEVSARAEESAEATSSAANRDAELEELRDRYLRLAAEFDNYRKRTEKERAEHAVRAQGKLVSSLLEVIDDLERVADFTPETTTVAALLEGVQMVERKLLRALEAAGLERLEPRGARFDPEHHEALMTADTEHPHEDDTVGEVFQKGYRFQGHLLRPARVQVRKHSG